MDQSLKSYTSPSASDAALLPVDRRIRAQQRSTGSAGQRSSGLAAQWISWSYIASHDVAAGGGQQPTRARHDPSSQTCKSGSPDYRASIICHSTTTFETRGRPHAHIVFIGNAEIEERRKARRFLTTASRSIPSTIRTAWRASISQKERTPQVGYARSGFGVRSLNARGVATARGSEWTAVQVGSILRRVEGCLGPL